MRWALDDPNTAGPPARAAFTKLSERLTDIDQSGTIATDVYVPSGYRGILSDTGGFRGDRRP